MAIITVVALLLAVVGVVGVIAVFAIPGWRLAGPGRRPAAWRLTGFLVSLAVGLGLLAWVASRSASVILS